MNTIKSIRHRLGVTQAALAEGMGCSQSNVSFYEAGQTIPPERAEALITFAAGLGHALTFNDVYAPSPPDDGEGEDAEVVTAGYTGPDRRHPERPPLAFPDLDRRGVDAKA